jgi:hypothetical protein
MTRLFASEVCIIANKGKQRGGKEPWGEGRGAVKSEGKGKGRNKRMGRSKKMGRSKRRAKSITASIICVLR